MTTKRMVGIPPINLHLSLKFKRPLWKTNYPEVAIVVGAGQSTWPGAITWVVHQKWTLQRVATSIVGGRGVFARPAIHPHPIEVSWRSSTGDARRAVI
jgi:hypothetical protein